jgi:hypothetical protein
LIAARAAIPLRGWKDPRTCLFLDFWEGLLPDASYVMLYRHPMDVAFSLWRRDTERELRSDPWLAIHAWEVYNRLLLAFRELHPGRCFLAQVPALTGDLAGFVQRVGEKLDLALNPEGVAALFFAGELSPESAAESLEGSQLLAGALALYRELEQVADLPRSSAPLAANASTGDGGRDADLFNFVLASGRQQRALIAEQRQRLHEMNQELVRQRRRSVQVQADLAAGDAALAAAQAELDSAAARRDELATVLSHIESSRSFGLVRAWWWLFDRLRRVLVRRRADVRADRAAGAVLPFTARPEARRDTATGQRAATSPAPPAG